MNRICLSWMMIQERYLGAGSEVGVFPWLQESSAESGQLGLKHGHPASCRGHEFIRHLQSRTQSALSLTCVHEHSRQCIEQVLHQLWAQTHFLSDTTAAKTVSHFKACVTPRYEAEQWEHKHTKIQGLKIQRERMIRFKPLYSLWDSPADCRVLGWKYLRKSHKKTLDHSSDAMLCRTVMNSKEPISLWNKCFSQIPVGHNYQHP